MGAGDRTQILMFAQVNTLLTEVAPKPQLVNQLLQIDNGQKQFL